MVVAYKDLLLIMAGTVFVLGITTFFLGIFVLVSRAVSRDLKTLTTQTTRLAQKGINDDIPGLVGNASALITALQQLVRTAAGIGVFLTLLGLGLIYVSYWMVQQIQGII